MSHPSTTWTLLFAEDESDNRALFARYLEEAFEQTPEAIDLLLAPDGQAALDIIAAEAALPDVVVTDWEMPRVNGLELIKALKSNPSTSGIPVIMISGVHLDRAELEQGLEAGAIEYVRKPIEPLELVARVKAVFKLVAQQRTLLAQQQQLAAAHLELEKERAATAVREAEQQAALAEASERIKRDFYARVTHELRTPLTLILGPLEHLATHIEDEDLQRSARLAYSNSRLMLKMVNQLLDLSRAEAGYLDITRKPGKLVGFVQSRVDAFESLCKQRDLTLTCSVPAEDIEAIYDPVAMEQLLNNLLSNAVKFTQPGGRIHVQVEQADANTVRIAVSDTGKGIPPAQLPFLFDTYYREPEQVGANVIGTGLGLSIVRELVELHGGSVQAESQPGVGSTFTIELPLEPQLEADQSNVSVSPETVLTLDDHQEELQQVENNGRAPETIAVLVVDDNPDIRQYVSELLEPEYTVTVAENGEVALELAIQLVPDVVVTDVQMPQKNGNELCRALKQHPATSHIPVIMLTAYVQLPHRLRGLESGADAYLGKPFSQDELRLRIKKLLETRQQLRERYRQEMLLQPDMVEATSMDEAFLMKLRGRMSAHLQNEYLTIEELASEMALSRTQLHRKLKALTGENASAFVRNFRLDRARQLLEQQAAPVGEVAFLTGFASASYFSRAFSAKYGLAPREVRTQAT